MLIEKTIDLKNGIELKGYVKAKSFFDGEFNEEEFCFIGYAYDNKFVKGNVVNHLNIFGSVSYCMSCECTKEECEEAKSKLACDIPYKTYYNLPYGLNLYIDGIKL